jgi:hypothetical protein
MVDMAAVFLWNRALGIEYFEPDDYGHAPNAED